MCSVIVKCVLWLSGVFCDCQMCSVTVKCVVWLSGVFGGGLIRCPWHGACFSVKSGDIEDFPGLDSIPKFQVCCFCGWCLLALFAFSFSFHYLSFLDSLCVMFTQLFCGIHGTYLICSNVYFVCSESLIVENCCVVLKNTWLQVV